MKKEFLDGIVEEFMRKNVRERACTIVNQYFYMVELHLSRGEQVPDLMRETFAGWLHDPENDRDKDRAVMRALVDMLAGMLVGNGRKTLWSIDEVSAIYGMNPWTIRMWVNRFSILRPMQDGAADLMFRLEDVERIGIICLLTGVRDMTVEDVRKYLASDKDE